MPEPEPRPPGNWFAAMPVELPLRLLQSLRENGPKQLRWFAPDDIHLTVAFFGSYQSERLQAVQAVLRSLPPFAIHARLGRLVPLPSLRRFSAVSFELEAGAFEAAKVMRRFHTPLMEAAGLAPESRPAYPHVTIARPGRKASGQERREILDWMGRVEPTPVTLLLREVALYGWAENRQVRQFQRLKIV